MGRSGGGGGGFSGGGFSGGSRSSGGFSGGSHSGGRSAGSGSFGGSFGRSGHSAPRPPHHGGFGPIHMPVYIPVPVGRSGGGGSNNGAGGNGGSNGNGGNNNGCLTVIVVLVVVFIMLALLGSCTSCTSCADDIGSTGSVAASTVQREPLPASASQETAYYTDADGDWIHNPSKLESGLKSFYKDTGVRPYVYILPNGTTTSVSELTQRSEDLYGQLFSDEAHFLLVFCDDNMGGYACGYTVGSQAKTVMDDEAVEVLADYLDRYYQDLSLDEEEIFSKAFADTGERIMHVTTSPLVPIAVCVAVVAVVGGVVIVVKKRNERLEAERKHTAEVLSTPLEKFGDVSVEDLAKKYEDKQ